MKTSSRGPAALPLEGVRMVSLEHAVAAPFATRQLADLGARVIKVERPGTGDFARRYDRAIHGHASHFVWLNRGKESVAVRPPLPPVTVAGKEAAMRPVPALGAHNEALRQEFGSLDASRGVRR